MLHHLGKWLACAQFVCAQFAFAQEKSLDDSIHILVQLPSSSHLITTDGRQQTMAVGLLGSASRGSYGTERARWFLGVEDVTTAGSTRTQGYHREVVAYRLSGESAVPLHRQIVSALYPFLRLQGAERVGSAVWLEAGEDEFLTVAATDAIGTGTTRVYRATVSARDLEQAYQQGKDLRVNREDLAIVGQLPVASWQLRQLQVRSTPDDGFIVIGKHGAQTRDSIYALQADSTQVLWDGDNWGQPGLVWEHAATSRILVRTGTQVWSVAAPFQHRELVQDDSVYSWVAATTSTSGARGNPSQFDLRRNCPNLNACYWEVSDSDTGRQLWISLPVRMDAVQMQHQPMSLSAWGP